METFLAILMVLGIYVGAPLVIGSAIAGVIILGSRKTTRAKRAQALAEEAEAGLGTIAEAQTGQGVEAVAGSAAKGTREGA